MPRRQDIPFATLNLANVFALALSLAFHALLLAWTFARPGGPGAAPPEQGAPRILQVSLLAADASLARPAVHPPASSETPNGAATRNPARPAPRDASLFPAPPDYHPASALDEMPAALIPFEPELPDSPDDAGSKLVLRLWLNDAGAVDRIAVVSNTLREEFAEIVVAGFRRMLFAPAKIGGVAVKAWVDVVIGYEDLRKRPEHQLLGVPAG
ncbi:MAG TPA: hypothetical protein VEC06_07960 [Paucimonas sp.]|nr:hypothetical protein [Paucimonas sp.]